MGKLEASLSQQGYSAPHQYGYIRRRPPAGPSHQASGLTKQSFRTDKYMNGCKESEWL